MTEYDRHIVVTGATGLVGSYLIRTLLARGYTQVTGVRRTTSKLDLLGDVADSMAWLEGDLLDPYFCEEVAAAADVLVHAAALVSFDPRDRDEMLTANVSVTESLVNACLSQEVNQLVFVSSVAALGRLRSGATITEESDWTKSKENSAYAASKYLAEMEVWRAHAEGQPVIIINPAIILGGGYWDCGSTAVVGTVARGLPFYGTGATAVVDVRDVAEAIIEAIDRRIDGRRYILAGANVTYQELFAKLAQAVGAVAPRRPLPPWLGAIGWRVAALKARWTGKRPLITRETVRTSAFVSIYDHSKSVDELGLRYRSLDHTIDDIAAVYRADAAFGILPVT